MKCSNLAAAAFMAALSFSQGAFALTWNEIDAGDRPGTAEITLGGGLAPLTGINGFLSSTGFLNGSFVYQVDLYAIRITDASNFQVTTSSQADTALFLFDADGFGVVANDDSTSNLLASFSKGTVQTAGLYYLGIGMGGAEAQDAGGQNLFLSGGLTDQVAGNPNSGSLASWQPGYFTGSETKYSYSIALTGASVAAVPEPSAALMLGLGLAGIAAFRRTRRQGA